MKIIVLTTETLHHTYVVQQLAAAFPLDRVIAERNTITPAFQTNHPFEQVREDYEQQAFFGSKNVSLADVANTLVVDSVNGSEALTYIKKAAPEIIITFGTGKISRELIQICPEGIVNLHGGDPEEYRGLDSHLWAIYHGDFQSLVVALHSLNQKLDDGDIVLQKAIPLTNGMLIHELRRYNSEICIELVLSTLDTYARYTHFISRPQRKRGRYYSFMPAVLKEICAVRFKEYTENVK